VVGRAGFEPATHGLKVALRTPLFSLFTACTVTDYHSISQSVTPYPLQLRQNCDTQRIARVYRSVRGEQPKLSNKQSVGGRRYPSGRHRHEPPKPAMATVKPSSAPIFPHFDVTDASCTYAPHPP